MNIEDREKINGLLEYDDELPFSSLLGMTLKDIEQVEENQLLFVAEDGSVFRMFHRQDCCECVTIEDINGDLEDLIGSPILKAEESSNNTGDKKDDSDDSYTWTFYHLATKKGYVTIRWYGSSNGYYSESVTFIGKLAGKGLEKPVNEP